jgi:adenylate kinase family enzyme
MLDSIISGPRPKPRRLMCYGTPGIGKSTFAAQADKPIFIPTEDGLGEIDCHRFPQATTLAQVLDAIASLYQEDHQFRTVVIDSLDWLERLIWNEVCLKRQVSSIEDIPYGKGYAFALSHWRDVLDGLTALRNERGMTVVLLAHAKVERFENPETESFDRYAPRLHKTARDMVIEWCDEVLFANYKVYTEATDEGFNRTRVQGVGSGERVLRTSERPVHIAKNRIGLPDELPLDWSALAKFIPITTNA